MGGKRAGKVGAERRAAFRLGEERFVVVSFALPGAGGAEGGGATRSLSLAEKEVLSLLLAGLDNRSIAARRRTALRTVANQVASIFRKLGVSSRQELAARVPALDAPE